jgi:hypothetical protein
LSKMQTEGGLLFPIASSSLASLPFLICDPALDAPSWTHHVGHFNTVRTTLYDRHPTIVTIELRPCRPMVSA